MADTMGGELITVRPAMAADRGVVAGIIMPTIEAGETYALNPGMSEVEALDYWFASDKQVFVAELAGHVVGSYYLRTNQPGGGSHVCNCGYMTSAAARGRGVARAMCLHSLEMACAAGYLAMQFNFVVTTNEGAVRLWQRLGFEIVGRLPEAFCHPSAGLVDALVMYRKL